MELSKYIVSPVSTFKIDGAEFDMYGRDSEEFRDLLRQDDRAKLASPEAVESVEDMVMRRTIAMTKEVRGVTNGGKNITDAALIYSQAPDIYEAVLAHWTQRANFLPKA